MRAQTSPVRCPVTLDRVADDVSAAKGVSLADLAWIGVGLRMEIYWHGRRIITSPVRAIETEPAPYASRPQ